MLGCSSVKQAHVCFRLNKFMLLQELEDRTGVCMSCSWGAIDLFVELSHFVLMFE